MDSQSEKAMRFNEGKLEWSLVDFPSLEPMVRTLEFGAKKYARENWKKEMDLVKIAESLFRHAAALVNGEYFDQESGIEHVGHIMCNCMFLQYHMNKNDMKESAAKEDTRKWNNEPTYITDFDSLREGMEFMIDHAQHYRVIDFYNTQITHVAGIQVRCLNGEGAGGFLKSTFNELCKYSRVTLVKVTEAPVIRRGLKFKGKRGPHLGWTCEVRRVEEVRDAVEMYRWHEDDYIHRTCQWYNLTDLKNNFGAGYFEIISL